MKKNDRNSMFLFNFLMNRLKTDDRDGMIVKLSNLPPYSTDFQICSTVYSVIGLPGVGFHKRQNSTTGYVLMNTKEDAKEVVKEINHKGAKIRYQRGFIKAVVILWV